MSGRRARRGHPWFAALYDAFTRSSERSVMPPLRRHIAGQATGQVLEIGAGTGANFPYYHVATNLVATEPDPFMLRRAKLRTQDLRVPWQLVQGAAEALPFPDCSFDTVVAALVLCTVDDPTRALAEIRRVLVPGGTFRFVEHVRAPEELSSRLQDVLTPLWREIGAGCHLNRATPAAIEAAALHIIELQEGIAFAPLAPTVAGVAQRGESTR